MLQTIPMQKPLLPFLAILATLAAPLGATGLSVVNVGLVAPDIIAVTIREGEMVGEDLVPYTPAFGETRALEGNPKRTWIKRGGVRVGFLVGVAEEWLRIVPTFDGAILDRIFLSDRRSFRLTTTESGVTLPTITALYRKSTPIDQGFSPVETDQIYFNFCPFQHTLFFQLSAPMPAGVASRIESVRDPNFPVTEFTIDTSRTVSEAIHVTQAGWRPGDPSKRAYLSLWLADAPNYGVYDYAPAVVAGQMPGSFRVVRDSDGQTVFSGVIGLKVRPDAYEDQSDTSRMISYDYDAAALPPELGVKVVTGGVTTAAKFNTAKTYVYEMDFSTARGWAAAPGTYRVVVDGIGSSRPFRIASSIWTEVGSFVARGLYHQRSGISLDGRFGYTRPRSFHPADGVVIQQSSWPFMFSTEGGLSSAQGGNPAYAASVASGPGLTNAWGGYMDAGDWDRRTQSLSVTQDLIDLVNLFPVQSAALDLGLPPLHDVLPHLVPAAGGELPDLVQEIVWNLDFFRRLQRADGAVSGGIESSRTPQRNEPSWLESEQIFAYAPDPVASYLYAGVAAKAAVTLRRHAPELATVFRESAFRAWTWAETERLRDSLFDPLYDYLRLVKYPGNLSQAGTNYQAAVNSIESSMRDARAYAAAEFWKESGETAFRDAYYAETRINWANTNGAELTNRQLRAAWAFNRADFAGSDPVRRATAGAHVIRTMADQYVNPGILRYSMGQVKHVAVPHGYGLGSVPTADSVGLMRAYALDPRPDFLRVAADGVSFVLGGNQANLSLVAGYGSNPVKMGLHVDSRETGKPTPDGIVVYGFGTPQSTNQWGFLFTSSWSDLSDADPFRAIYPPRLQWPFLETVHQHPLFISSMEFTVQQTIAPVTTLALFLGMVRDETTGLGAVPSLAAAVPVGFGWERLLQGELAGLKQSSGSAPAGDADGDGIPNLVEYVLQLSPLVRSAPLTWNPTAGAFELPAGAVPRAGVDVVALWSEFPGGPIVSEQPVEAGAPLVPPASLGVNAVLRLRASLP